MEKMECGICYETRNSDRICFLECGHSLCNECLGHLVSLLCPFCRYPIPEGNSSKTVVSQSWPPISARTLIRRDERNRRQMVVQPQFPRNIWFPSETETTWGLRRLLRMKQRHREFIQVHREVLSDPEDSDEEEWEVFMIEVEKRADKHERHHAEQRNIRNRKISHRPRTTHHLSNDT